MIGVKYTPAKGEIEVFVKVTLKKDMPSSVVCEVTQDLMKNGRLEANVVRDLLTEIDCTLFEHGALFENREEK